MPDIAELLNGHTRGSLLGFCNDLASVQHPLSGLHCSISKDLDSSRTWTTNFDSGMPPATTPHTLFQIDDGSLATVQDLCHWNDFAQPRVHNNVRKGDVE